MTSRSPTVVDVKRPWPRTKSHESPSSPFSLRTSRPSGTDHTLSVAGAVADQQVVLGPEVVLAAEVTGLGSGGRRDGPATAAAAQLGPVDAPLDEPFTIRAEGHTIEVGPRDGRRHQLGRPVLQHAQGEEPGFLGVGELQALRHVGQRRGRIPLELGLAKGEQLAGLGPQSLGVRSLPCAPRSGSRGHRPRRDRRRSAATIAATAIRRRRLRRFASAVIARPNSSSSADSPPA